MPSQMLENSRMMGLRRRMAAFACGLSDVIDAISGGPSFARLVVVAAEYSPEANAQPYCDCMGPDEGVLSRRRED